jgi:hypothetical protein
MYRLASPAIRDRPGFPGPDCARQALVVISAALRLRAPACRILRACIGRSARSHTRSLATSRPQTAQRICQRTCLCFCEAGYLLPLLDFDRPAFVARAGGKSSTRRVCCVGVLAPVLAPSLRPATARWTFCRGPRAAAPRRVNHASRRAKACIGDVPRGAGHVGLPPRSPRWRWGVVSRCP